MQDRQARPVRRDHRGRARAAEADVGGLFGGDREACRVETVGHRRGQALRAARSSRLLLWRGDAGTVCRRRHLAAMNLLSFSTSAALLASRTFLSPRAISDALLNRNSHGA